MAKNTVRIKCYMPLEEEYAAAAAITPGNLIELASTGKVQKHSNASQNALTMIALEDELQGKDIDEDYAADDRVKVWIPQRGDIVYALLADGNNASIGDFLESNGAGLLQIHTPQAVDEGATNTYSIYTEGIVAQAIEAVNASGADERIKVRIL